MGKIHPFATNKIQNKNPVTMKVKHIGTIFLFILFAIVLKGQNNMLELKGVILDASNENPLPFANVYLKADIIKGTVTGTDGAFVLFVENKFLTDTLVISFIGFKEKKVPVNALSDKSNNIYIYQKTHNIKEATVKAKRVISEEFTIEKINQLDIYLNPLSKADPLLSVNGMAASTTTDESASISLRGSSPTETGIFFNEVPVYDAVRFQQLNGIGTFSIFNTSVVDKMLIFPSNPPIEYGNTTSGLVSIYTSDDLPEKSNSISLSLANIGVYFSGNIRKKTGLTVFSNYQPSDVFVGLNSESMRDLKSFNTTDLGILVNQKINNKTFYKIFSYSNTEGFEIGIRHPGYTGNFSQDKQRTFLVSNFIKKFNNGELSINNGLSISDEKYKYGNTDIDIRKNDLYGAISFLFFPDKISFKTGYSIDYRLQKTNGNFPLYYYAIDPSSPVTEVNSSSQVPIHECFAYIKYYLTKKIVIGGGSRKNIPVAEQDSYLSYQLNLSFDPDKFSSINISAGSYNKYNPPTNEITETYFINNYQYSVDYKYSGKKIEISQALFYKNATINNNPEKIKGAEFFVKYFVTDRLNSQLSYTFIDAVKKEEVTFPSQTDLNYFIRSSISYTFIGNLNISAVILMHQGTYYQPVTGSTLDNITNTYIPVYSDKTEMKRLPDYSKIDLNISRIFSINDSWNIIGFLGINNLTNKNNVREINYNNDYTQSFNEYFSKRTIYFGGVINF